MNRTQSDSIGLATMGTHYEPTKLLLQSEHGGDHRHWQDRNYRVNGSQAASGCLSEYVFCLRSQQKQQIIIYSTYVILYPTMVLICMSNLR